MMVVGMFSMFSKCVVSTNIVWRAWYGAILMMNGSNFEIEGTRRFINNDQTRMNGH